jgi:hypothetical protein
LQDWEIAIGLPARFPVFQNALLRYFGIYHLGVYQHNFGSEFISWLEPENHLEVTRKDLERALFPRIHGCQLFTIENGTTGAVAGNCCTGIGDEIWVLSGGVAPFILRRVSEAEYRLITPCFLTDHMGFFVTGRPDTSIQDVNSTLDNSVFQGITLI